MITNRDIMKFLEQIAPRSTSLKWDNSGLQVGDLNNEVTGILLALDLSESVLEEANDLSANLIITHHPLIFEPLKVIDFSTPIGNMIYTLIKRETTHVAVHTNLDRSFVGTGRIMADRIGLKDVERYTRDIEDEMNMIFTGVFDPPKKPGEVIAVLKESLSCPVIQMVGKLGETTSVAIIPGSGGALLKRMDKSFDLIVTGEISYHDALSATSWGMTIAAPGHFTTEKPVMFHLGEMLRHRYPDLPIQVSTCDGEPYELIW